MGPRLRRSWGTTFFCLTAIGVVPTPHYNVICYETFSSYCNDAAIKWQLISFRYSPFRTLSLTSAIGLEYNFIVSMFQTLKPKSSIEYLIWFCQCFKHPNIVISP